MFSSLAQDLCQPRVAAAFETLVNNLQRYSDDVGPDYLPHGSSLRTPYEEFAENYFKVILNTCHFLPEEVTVRKEDGDLIVHAEHNLKPDGHGYISREFTRRFKLPDDVEENNIKPVFHRNGLLVITAPRKATESTSDSGVTIPVILQKPLRSSQEEDAALQQDEATPTGTQYIVREVL